MQYAIQTRDYKNDYHWSWEHRGRDFPLAKISMELQSQIEDTQQGVAVLYRNGSFHVIFTALYKLGEKSLGTDFSSANIRLNLVFSEISHEKTKGLLRYYLSNRNNPGKAFADIVIWENNSWRVNEEKVKAAFDAIPEYPKTGKFLLSDKKNVGLQSVIDFDFCDQSEGVKYVLQPDSANPFRIDINAIPEPKPVPAPEPPKKQGGSWLGKVLVLLLIIGLAGLSTTLFVLLNQQSKDFTDTQIKLQSKSDELDKLKQQMIAPSKYQQVEKKLVGIKKVLQCSDEEILGKIQGLNKDSGTLAKIQKTLNVDRSDQVEEKIKGLVTFESSCSETKEALKGNSIAFNLAEALQLYQIILNKIENKDKLGFDINFGERSFAMDVTVVEKSPSPNQNKKPDKSNVDTKKSGKESAHTPEKVPDNPEVPPEDNQPAPTPAGDVQN